MHKFLIIIAIIIALLSIHPYNGYGQQMDEKVYWMVTIDVSMGKLADFHAFNGKEMSPAMDRYGYKPVVVWQTIVGDIEQVIFVAEFVNMEAYNKARIKWLGSDEWKVMSKKLDLYAKKITTKFLRSTPYSKLK